MSYDWLLHIRHYGFLSPNKRGTLLPLIRALLGCAASNATAPPPGSGESEAEEEPAHRCRECGVGTLILDFEMARPSVAEIMRLSRERCIRRVLGPLVS